MFVLSVSVLVALDDGHQQLSGGASHLRNTDPHRCERRLLEARPLYVVETDQQDFAPDGHAALTSRRRNSQRHDVVVGEDCNGQLGSAV